MSKTSPLSCSISSSSSSPSSPSALSTSQHHHHPHHHQDDRKYKKKRNRTNLLSLLCNSLCNLTLRAWPMKILGIRLRMLIFLFSLGIIYICFQYMGYNATKHYNNNNNDNNNNNEPHVMIPDLESQIMKAVVSESNNSTSVNRHPNVYYRGNVGLVGNYESLKIVGNVKANRANRPGDYGVPYHLDPNSLPPNEQDGIVQYGMNMAASSRIPMDRIVPDVRHRECRYWVYPDAPDSLPTASVVIVFHNEGFTTLLRTVHSVLLRSPQRFLREILLVDDYSDREPLGLQLDRYIEDNFSSFKWKQNLAEQPITGETLQQRSGKVRLIRNTERSGLIGSRTRGAQEAIGQVVVFLDAHCEVNYNWLVPLLTPIATNPQTLTVPIIDGIDWNTFEYRPVYAADQHFIGIWEWGMLYKEQHLSSVEHRKRHQYYSEPYESPTHAGGLFAINREYFLSLGAYDPGLLVWGGENFELSFKVWQCGGRLLWVPCSRVGHIYRSHMPYTFGKLATARNGAPLILTNYKRVIEVWFDQQQKEWFYTREPMARYYDAGNITEQLMLKQRLQCKSFEWFLQNHANAVYRDFPPLPPNFVWGEIRSVLHSTYCLDTTGANPPAKVIISRCHGHGGNQMFRLNTRGQLGFGERCIEAESFGSELHVGYCKLGTVDGPWSWDSETWQIRYQTDYCIMLEQKTTAQMVVSLKSCMTNDANEQGGFIAQQWKWNELRPK